MRIPISALGLASGTATSLSLLPFTLILCFFFKADTSPDFIRSLFAYTICSRLFGEWLFWKYFRRRMDLDPKLLGWRSIINQSLFFHPNIAAAILVMFIDSCIDAALLYIALIITPILPIWVFLPFLGCQVLASPVQGIFSDFFSQKKSLLFASLMGILTVFTILIILVGKVVYDPTIPLSGILHLVPSTMQLLFVICIKGLLGNQTVVARGIIAKQIKAEALKKFENRNEA